MSEKWPQRQLNGLDQLIIRFDGRLKQRFSGSAPKLSSRPNPAQDMPEPPLSLKEKRHVAGLMRVNHAGEISAQGLYEGQALTAKDPAVQRSMQNSAAEEADHLAWCEQRLTELNSHTSYLNPVWYLGSFSIGALAGACGDKWSLGFVVETEHQVERHLDTHLQYLPPQDTKSRVILEQMQLDEVHHAAVAAEAGAAALPKPVKTLMRFTAKIMTTTAYWV